MDMKEVCLQTAIGNVVVRSGPVPDAGSPNVNAARTQRVYRDAARSLLEDTQWATVGENDANDTAQPLDP
ncbi:hypothetical protein [Alicyclobacillus pomorum]|uniref:hypothetical protein n=1 Tax=Alicyclobacillus pomorum TaxID=204470 RepID=UPI000479DED1|nr:hypothetical protein [Alicyclobacillus pomorum]